VRSNILPLLADLRNNPASLSSLADLSSDLSSKTYPALLRRLFENLGGTYVKLGQFIASSPTLFPREYVDEFTGCLDKTPPVPFRQIHEVIVEELAKSGRTPAATFREIDPVPLASASVAQVHTATLLDGTPVVLKVQKPGVDQSLQADLAFIYSAGKLLEFLNPELEKLSLAGVAEDIRASMLDELDFVKESRNVMEFRTFLESRGLTSEVTAPEVYPDLTSEKLLVMEKLVGVSLVEGGDEQRIISALNVWTMSVTSMPWFHADVHGGNLLALSDGRVGFIDFGIVRTSGAAPPSPPPSPPASRRSAASPPPFSPPWESSGAPLLPRTTAAWPPPSPRWAPPPQTWTWTSSGRTSSACSRTSAGWAVSPGSPEPDGFRGTATRRGRS
jgi:predicted unusual protein kinase regulating ubiquinone biosynthesis (AarF/ABC1/UbiB family)